MPREPLDQADQLAKLVSPPTIVRGQIVQFVPDKLRQAAVDQDT